MQPECRGLPPEQHNPDDTSDGALEQDVVPRRRQGGGVVQDRPVVHHVPVLAPEGAAEGVDDDGVLQAGGRSPGAEPGYVVQAPQQQGDGQDLDEPQRRMLGRERTPGDDGMPAPVGSGQRVHPRHRL